MCVQIRNTYVLSTHCSGCISSTVESGMASLPASVVVGVYPLEAKVEGE